MRGISKIYNKGKNNEVEALKSIDLTIEKGETLAIMGVSGSGKSTLLNMLGCLDSPTTGGYFVDGKDIAKYSANEIAEFRNAMTGFILQDGLFMLNETVFENVKLPLVFSKKYKIKEIKGRVAEVLEQVGIKDLLKRKMRELSGGQHQRVAIARALVNNPQIVLADEPTASLDSKTASEIIDLLLSLNKDGKTIIMVTHDINIAKKMHKLVNIVDGKLI
ncbi:MAG: ABC transporter ATP-binding protein [Clostridia bacterium]